MPWQHWPFVPPEDAAGYLARTYEDLRGLMAAGAKVLVHGDELNDRICGLMGGYLLWSGLVPDGPSAITVIERMTQRQLGPVGREIVSVAAGLEGPS